MPGKQNRRSSTPSTPPPPIPSPSSPSPSSPSLLSTVKEGFAFGVGSSIARNVIDNMFDKDKDKAEVPQEKKTVENKDVFKLYNDCMENSDKDKNNCRKILSDSS